MTCGVYSITNTVTNKIYIGSSKSIKKRLYEHMRLLKNERHPNIKLSRSTTKHGLNSFVCKTELICDEKNLLMYEQLLINFYDAAANGYNVNKKAERGVSKELELLSEDFFSSRSKLQENGCRIATVVASKSGSVSVKRGGKLVSFHRLAHEFYAKDIPEGYRVLRTCGNKGCINPEHLVVANRSDIAKHSFAIGRIHPRGNVKLIESQVMEIKMSNKPMLQLAKKYNVSDGTIRKIKHNETWRHVNVRVVSGEDSAPLEPFSIDPQPYPMRVWG